MNENDKTRIIQPRDNPQPASSTGATRVISTAGTPPTPPPINEGQGATRVISTQQANTVDSNSEDSNMLIELTTGWLVIVEGPGRGCSMEVFAGMNSIGRDPNERIPLDFGDEAISRQAHAFIVFDEKQNDFYIQHGGKSNLVRLNDSPVLAPIVLNAKDIIEIGNTKMMFVPLCDETFSWDAEIES